MVAVPETPSPRLYNGDRAPVRNRNWGVDSIFAMWMQDIHSITVCTFAASLFLLGINGIQALIALSASVMIMWGLMNLGDIAGQRTGLPFPVLTRSSFGVWGARRHIRATIRVGTAVIYSGILTYLGSTGLQIAALRVAPSVAEPLTEHSFLGLHALGWLSFAVMWVIQLLDLLRPEPRSSPRVGPHLRDDRAERVLAAVLSVLPRHLYNDLFANYYAPLQQPPEPGQLRIGQHTDYGSLTLLYQRDAVGGLEGPQSRRLSLPFFCQPNYDAVIAPIPTCVTPHAPPKYPGITAGDNVTGKTHPSFAVG